MHTSTVISEEIDNPIPAIGRLDHHPGSRPASATAAAIFNG
jgi:hypothetical protein